MEVDLHDLTEIDPNTLVDGVAMVGSGKDHAVIYFQKPEHFTGDFFGLKITLTVGIAAKLYNALDAYFKDHPKPNILDRANQPKPEGNNIKLTDAQRGDWT